MTSPTDLSIFARDPKELPGKVRTDFTYDPPAKYQGKKNARGQLVGTRIDPSTPLGQELAKLRMMWQAAAEAQKRIDKDDPDLARRINEVSQNVPVDPVSHATKVYREQRRMVIRKRMYDIIQKAIDEHGRPPTTIGVPSETIDEVREACCDLDVKFVVEDPAEVA